MKLQKDKLGPLFTRWSGSKSVSLCWWHRVERHHWDTGKQRKNCSSMKNARNGMWFPSQGACHAHGDWWESWLESSWAGHSNEENIQGFQEKTTFFNESLMCLGLSKKSSWNDRWYVLRYSQHQGGSMSAIVQGTDRNSVWRWDLRSGCTDWVRYRRMYFMRGDWKFYSSFRKFI